jgi:hypothetical protein
MVTASAVLCRDFHRRVQVESFGEACHGFCPIGNYDSWRDSETGSNTSMGHVVFPGLVLDFCRYLVGGAGCGMSLLFLTLPGSPD